MSLETRMSLQSASQGQQETEMKTFVLLDLETTGLEIGKRVTELSLLVYTRDEFLSIGHQLRVCSKLTLCLNPERPISPDASALSGLTNKVLEELPSFNAHASVIVSFLRNFQAPVCLVAHNGDRFDFPLLKAEFKNCDMETSLDGFFCADSIKALKYLDMHGGQSAALPQAQDSNGHEKSASEMKDGQYGKPRKSYSLSRMYQEEFGRAPDAAHTAEGDCISVLEVIRRGGGEHCAGFVSWCDMNARPFRQVKASL